MYLKAALIASTKSQSCPVGMMNETAFACPFEAMDEVSIAFPKTGGQRQLELPVRRQL